MSRNMHISLALVLSLVAIPGAAWGDDAGGVALRFSVGASAVTVTVSGTITDAKTHKPIPNALVRGHVVIWRHQGPELFDKCPYQEVQAGSDGKYALRFVTPLTTSGPMKGKDGICVYASAPGYETRPLYVKPRVTPEKTTYKSVDIALGPGKLVKGQVVDNNSKPIEGALVTVQNGSNGDWNYFGSLGRTSTDPNGNFAIWCSTDTSAVISSRPWLYILKRGYGAAYFWDLLKTESMGQLVVPAGGTVTGKVIGENDQGIPGCEVSAHTWRGVVNKTLTDRSGRYTLNGIPDHATAVRFFEWKNKRTPPRVLTAATVYARGDREMNLRDVPHYTITADAGQTVTGPDLVVGAAAGVSGRLLASKNPFGLKGLMVRLDYEWARMVEADADGTFSFPYVQPGKHRLTAYLPNNLRGDRGIGRTEINVKPGKPLENVAIQLETLAEVRMRILDMKGNPLEGITAGATWTKSGDGFWTEGTRSDKDGWAVLYLHPGQVQYVRGFDPNRALVAEGYKEVKPKAGKVIENLRVIMVPTVRITGQLTGEAAGQLAARRVSCRLTYADGTERTRRVKVDASGHFTLDRLTPGIVRLTVETDPLELRGTTPAAVEIKPGDSKDVGQIALKKVKLYKVSGKLLSSPTFDDLAGFKMRLGLGTWQPMVPTDAEGRFVLPKVPAGKHRVTAYLPFNCRTDRGVGHVYVTVKDGNLDNVKLPLETLATIRMRIVDDSGRPLEGISAAAWWTKNHSGVFTEGTKSDKQGSATLYLYPKRLQYIGAHDWAGKYRLTSDKKFTLKPGDQIKDLIVVMAPVSPKD